MAISKRTLRRLCVAVPALAASVLMAAPAWGDYVIYVAGTSSLIPGQSYPPATDLLGGSFNAGNTVQTVSYPETFGILSILTYQGPGLPPTINASTAIGVAALDAQIKADQAADPSAKIYVVSISQGSVVATQEAINLTNQGPASYNNVTFVMTGNPQRANGGMDTMGIPINIPGVTGGPMSTATPPTNGPKIVNVTNQYDPFADLHLGTLPQNLMGATQLLTGNATSGYGPHDYTKTNITPAMVDSGNYPTTDQVTQTGNVTDVYIPATTTAKTAQSKTVAKVKPTTSPMAKPAKSHVLAHLAEAAKSLFRKAHIDHHAAAHHASADK